jgi:arabinose-5-phosphate isomerase
MAISNSGETAEIISLLPSVKKIGAKIISLTGSPTSTLARESQIVIDVGVEREACPLGLAPTSSTTATLVIGDALAVALMRQRKFGEKDFARLHPGGNLGERLNLRVKELMRPVSEVPAITKESTVGDFLEAIARQSTDFAFVIHQDGSLAGVIADRDLRRGDIGSPQFPSRRIGELMNPTVSAVDENTSAAEAMRAIVEGNLVALPILDKEKRLRGAVTLRDLLHRGDLRVF